MPSRLHPILESRRAAAELTGPEHDVDVLAYLDQLSQLVLAVVPDCVGLSVAWLDLGLSFTLVASDLETASLDAVQYLDGGPCVDVTPDDGVLETREDAVLDEGRWQMFGLAAAAHGIASTLTIPVLDAGAVAGTVNLYASTPDAFEGHHEVLAAIAGGHAAVAVRNADLSFTTLTESRRAPATLEAQRTVATAAGLLAARMDVDVDEAVESMRRAAQRAGVEVEDVARVVVESHERGTEG
ncbi:GAF and ANTAR domain-containing protein [Nocardioides sp. CFH 31398]|uniref:GAF and ANTAR domain-containing protein n=1 Tax=Nocardioides sp. CFH 31398 TaxID=2919579 RepID=UPI001F05827C|nr:GAF and ANTAR domain-containing protein [Nocardioides sp. CFH 31398]MCH1868798.1 GAF and ANTAR domain-containing protein [Nocardioides sp. CFH 31398]